MDISIVVPVYNEQGNIFPLYKELKKALGKLGKQNEIIYVNDGSTDDSCRQIEEIKKKDKSVKLISFYKNFGQTAAFDAGIKRAKGKIIVTIDSDRQNDPKDIIPLVAKLDQGFDAVCGWRKKRHDLFSKRFFSYLANYFRRKLTSDSIHDSGCSLRVYKRKVFSDVDLYGEMHRFIPIILSMKGYKIAELEVTHRTRKVGKSKYGPLRLVKGLLDFMFILFLLRFSSRPLHIFGSIGILTFSLGFAISVYLTFIKLYFGEKLSDRPLLILAVLLIIIGIQFFIFGILAEILIRIYYKTHNLKPYRIKKSI